MTTTTRTDVHSPKHFQPQDYEFIGWIYLGDNLEKFDALNDDHAVRYMDEHEHGGPHEHDNQCDHCGAWFLYGSIWNHTPTNTYIKVGHDCAGARFQVPDRFRFELAYLKRRVQQHRAAMRKDKALAKWLDENPEASEAFAWAEEADTALESMVTRGEYGEFEAFTDETLYRTTKRLIGFNIDTIKDIRSKLIRFGSISDKQVAFCIKLANEGVEKQVDAKRIVEEIAAMEPMEPGRQEITGKIVSLKNYDNDYGDTVTKMLLVLATGHKVFVTLPSALIDHYWSAKESLTAEWQSDEFQARYEQRVEEAMVTGEQYKELREEMAKVPEENEEAKAFYVKAIRKQVQDSMFVKHWYGQGSIDEYLKDKTVTLNVTIKPRSNDFAIGSRPAKARLVEEGGEA